MYVHVCMKGSLLGVCACGHGGSLLAECACSRAHVYECLKRCVHGIMCTGRSEGNFLMSAFSS